MCGCVFLLVTYGEKVKINSGRIRDDDDDVDDREGGVVLVHGKRQLRDCGRDGCLRIVLLGIWLKASCSRCPFSSVFKMEASLNILNLKWSVYIYHYLFRIFEGVRDRFASITYTSSADTGEVTALITERFCFSLRCIPIILEI